MILNKYIIYKLPNDNEYDNDNKDIDNINVINNDRCLICYNNTSFYALERHVNNLVSRKNIEKEELNFIYNDIENFIHGGPFYIQIFLSLIICYSYDFEILFNGIFSKHQEIRQKVKNIYNILSNDVLGNILLRKKKHL